MTKFCFISSFQFLFTGDEDHTFFAVLDEASAALDVRAEVCCYSALQKRGIGFLSVSNRPSLLPFHAKVLILIFLKIQFSAFKTSQQQNFVQKRIKKLLYSFFSHFQFLKVMHLGPSIHHGAYHLETVEANSNQAVSLLKTKLNAEVDGEATIGNMPPQVMPRPEPPRILTPRVPPPRRLDSGLQIPSSGSNEPPARNFVRTVAFAPAKPTLVRSSTKDSKESKGSFDKENQNTIQTPHIPKSTSQKRVEFDETGAVLYKEDLPQLPFPRQEFGDAHLNPRHNTRRRGRLSMAMDHPPRRSSFG